MELGRYKISAFFNKSACKRLSARLPKKEILMADIFTGAERSKLMAKIRGRGNRTTELRLITLLRENGLHGWRRHLALPGTPDFTFSRQRTCVFVHGCFWHGCPRCRKVPMSNSTFWRKKIEGNRRRDRKDVHALKKRGYKVIVIWECQLRRNLAAQSIERLRHLL